MFAQADQRFLTQGILHWAQRGECTLCGQRLVLDRYQKKEDAPSFDHITPRADGGGDGLYNLALAHQGCNEDRGRGPLSPSQERRVAFRATRLNTFLFNLRLSRAGDGEKQ